MRREITAWGVGLTLAAVLTGCTSSAAGTPTAADTVTTTTTSPSEDKTYGAPRVDDPLDATPFLAQPCSILTPAQLGSFNVSKPGKPETTGPLAERAGPLCIWHSDGEPSRTLDVGFLIGNKNGLSDTYRGGAEAFPGYFEPTTVDGYPAVFNDLIDERDRGACNLTVGINDNLTFRTSVQAPSIGRQACDEAVQTARAVIATLKAGG